MDPAIVSRGIVLRPIAAGDEPLYCALYTDAEVMRRVGEPLSAEAARDAFARVLRQVASGPPRVRYWILSRSGTNGDAQGMGLLALFVDRDDAASAEFGVLLQPEGQGQGVATRAVAALADHVFAVPGLARLWTRHAPGHAAAIGVMRRLGFVPVEDEGTPAQVRWTLARADWRIGGFAMAPGAD